MTSEKTDSKNLNIFYMIFSASIIFHIGAIIVSKTSLMGWSFIHDPLHSILEFSGSVIAFFVAYLLIVQDEFNKGTSYNKFIAGSLISMGFLDGLHAFFHAGHHFVLYHSLATFLGGSLFLSVYFPTNFSRLVKPHFIKISIFLTLTLVFFSALIPPELVKMVNKGEFTFLAKFLNIFGGIALLLSGFKLLYTYKKSKNVDDIVFFLHCTLFGLAATMFQESKLWDFSWWGWHMLRFAAYVTALYFAFRTHRLLKTHHDILSKVVVYNNTEQTAKIGSWSLDFNTSSLFWSDETYRIHELEVGAKVELDEAINFYHPDDRAKIQSFVAEGMKNGTPWNDEFTIITAKGKKVKVRAIGKVIFDSEGNPKMAMGSFQDISIEVNNREELLASKEEAILAKDKAETAEKAKTRFLANMSHEIRTPLNGVLGSVQILKDSPLNDKQSLLINNIHKSGEDLLFILNDILDYSSIISGKITIKNLEFDILELLHDVANNFSAKATEKNNKLNVSIPKDAPRYYTGDRLRIKQIVTNFLSNSIKFTENDQITVGFEYHGSTINVHRISFFVKDNGPGIPSQLKENLFTPFEQGDQSLSKMHQGTGLGLSISKSLATALDGTIRHQNNEPKGSIFYFDISLNLGDETFINMGRKFSDSEPQYKSTQNADVLVVEDNKINRSIIVSLLEKIGLNCAEAENGEDAINIVREKGPESFQLIFMDLQMPVMDGLTASKKLLEAYPTQPLKIIAVTANAFEEDKDTCLNIGMVDFISKPFKIKDLENVVKKHSTSK